MSTFRQPPSNLDVHAAWEKPVIAATGGTTHLLIRLKASDVATKTGQRRAPVDVAFVLDRSGSMSGDKLALVKEAVSVAAGHLRDEDRTALVIYDHAVETLHHLQPATPRAKTSLRLSLQGVDAGGSTNLSGGWLTGCDELAKAIDQDGRRGPIRIRRTLLLTDGLANVGITSPPELTKHATELRRRGIATTTLGVGLDFDEDLLSSMAEAGGGNFQFIERSDQLRGFFERELGELLTVIAADLSLTLTLPHGVRARLINAFPAERHGKRIDVALRDLPVTDELNLIFAITVAPGTADTTYAIALDATWSDPANDRRDSFEVSLPLRVTDDATARATPVDPTVAEQVELQQALVTQREAMRLDRQGRHAESRATLRQSADRLAAAAPTTAVLAMRMEADQLASYDADIMLSEDVRKSTTFRAMRRSRGKRDEG